MALRYSCLKGVLPRPPYRSRRVWAHAQGQRSGGKAVPWHKQAADVVQHARTQDVSQAFAVAGHWNDLLFAAAAQLKVDGLPDGLQLPLRAETVDALLAMGTPAPYGQGTETVLDPAVRKATQVDASKLTAGALWGQQLQQLVSRLAGTLGVEEGITVTANPYKLLVYTQGGHFKSHQDTEKEPGMFGTLVVQLPVVGGHEGGEFVFKHHGKTVSWDTAASSSSTFQYAADVEHELRSITAGARVVLVYNLVRTGQGAKPMSIDGSPLVKTLRGAISKWEQDLAAGKAGVPQMLCVALEHQYTQASLSFNALKGTDAKVASCLNHPDAGLDVHIALLSHNRMYHDGTYGARTELMFSSCDVSCCVSAHGCMPGYPVWKTLGLTKENTLQLLTGAGLWDDCSVVDEDGDDEDAPEYWKPNNEQHTGWMGNEGNTMEYFYSQGVMIIWPRSHAATLLAKQPTYLLELLQQRSTPAEFHAAAEACITQFAKRLQEMELRTVSRNGYQRYHDSKDHIEDYYGEGEDAQTICQLLVTVSSKLPQDVAVPALQTLIQHLPTLYNKGLQKAIVAAVAAVGAPYVLIKAVTQHAKGDVDTQIEAHSMIAARAADKCMTLSTAAADIVLQKTVLAKTAQQVIAGLNVSAACSVARMLCQLPSCHQHMPTFATAVLTRSDQQALLQQLLQDQHIKSAAEHVPSAIRELAKARAAHLKQVAYCVVVTA